jgi:hypothetical protein
MRLAIVASTMTFMFVGYAGAATVTVVVDRDATLIEHPDGALASGAGPSVFAGRTNLADNGVWRALLHFELADTLPHGGSQTVEQVALVITNLTESNTAPREYRLHRVFADWGEGASSSARLVVAGAGTYRFESPQLTGDAVLFATRPELNFGWILIGDETVRQTVKALGSRENPDPAARPVLEITFRRPAGP